MSEDAANELQKAITLILKGHSPFVNIAGNRVFDKVPADRNYPYASFGPTQEVPDNADCIEASEYFIDIDCWSRAVGRQEVNRLANTIVEVLGDESVSISDNALVEFHCEGRRTVLDKDGLTWRTTLVFRAIVEKP